MIRRLNPTQLQGNFSKSNYFEGWFQKIYSQEHNVSFIIIYGFATANSTEEMGFIQLYFPNQEVIRLNFHKDDLYLNRKKHIVKFGSQLISRERIYISTDTFQIDLTISTDKHSTFKQKTMGNFYLIRGLPCYHCVIQNNSNVSGEIAINQMHYKLTNANGYLEKNWGTSFPDNYIWLHAIELNNPDNQLLFSQADIIYRNKIHRKHLGYVKINGVYRDLRRVKKQHISYQQLNPNEFQITIDDIIVELIIPKEKTKNIVFDSPKNGKMCSNITHHSDISVSLKKIDKVLYTTTLMAGNLENSIFK